MVIVLFFTNYLFSLILILLPIHLYISMSHDFLFERFILLNIADDDNKRDE